MAWQATFEICPKCGKRMCADTSTGDVVCTECGYESGHKMPEAIIEEQ